MKKKKPSKECLKLLFLQYIAVTAQWWLSGILWMNAGKLYYYNNCFHIDILLKLKEIMNMY